MSAVRAARAGARPATAEPRRGPPPVGVEAPGADRLAGAADEPLQVGEVVEGEQPDPGQLLGPREVVDVGAGVRAAGRARAALDQRRLVVGEPRPPDVEPKPRLRAAAPGPSRGAPAGSARRSRTGRRPSAIPSTRSSGSPIPSRWRGASASRCGTVIPTTPRISSLSRPSVPPIARPSTGAAETRSAAARRRSSCTPPWTIPNTAWRRGPLSLVPGEAAVQPAVGALHRARRVVAIGVVGRALVEGQRDVGAERRLHRHRLLRAQEALRSVHVGAEAHALLADLEHLPLARLAPAPPLDLVGDRAVGEREDLEAPGVGDDRPLPAHEPVQPAERRDSLRPRREHQVEGVAQHHLVAELGHLRRGQRANAAARRERDERRRLDRSVRRGGAARPGRLRLAR